MTQEQRRVHRNRISQTETNTVMLSSSEMRLGHGDRRAHVTNVTKILAIEGASAWLGRVQVPGLCVISHRLSHKAPPSWGAAMK